MIEFNTTYSKEELYELEIASQNLPNKFSVRSYVDNPNFNIAYDFLIVGSNIDNFVEKEDLIFPYCEEECKYVKRICNSSQHFMDGYSFTLDKIPEHIQYLDLFLARRGSLEKSDDFRIEFLTMLGRIGLFSYYFKAKETIETLFCGTFARVSDGWKFYPKFQKVYENRINILSRYKGGDPF